jgi:transcriptional regulator with XRE-family HTH domain
MKLRIKDVIKEKGLTIQSLANQMGINRVNLSSSINGNPTIETLNKIALALQVPISDLFEQPTDNTVNCPYCGNKIKLTKDGANYASDTKPLPAKAPEQSKDKEEQQPGETGPIP